MTYSVEYSKGAFKDLKKMDTQTRKLILSWIEKNLVNCSDPRVHGKSLRGNRQDEWRYRVGDYRILANIHDDKILIFVLKIGHCREVYD
ncbi:MAG: type II toxin-antitoxin system RelE/ParE family toxin [Ruminococcaceae bacterium]|nr:type II toxin-antitoxin system RelE/ParE family toxin [Oscillospiraceae bacterium]